MARAIDKEFEEADDTGVLDISGRNLRQFPVIPGDLVDYNLIFEADLSKNRFDKVPKEVVSFKALVKLNCHHNSIRWLPEELFLLVNLKEMDFSRNFLQKLPAEICSMKLHSINLSNNRLIALPNEIGNLKCVQFLDLSCNSLPELPDSFYTLGSLRHLNLHRNCLRDLSEDLCQFNELLYLDVSSNSLGRIPISLRHIRTLQIFSAEDNPLESPPPQICTRGLVHLCKYLERLEKKGSDLSLYGPNSRDDTLRRRERSYKRLSNMHRSSSETTPVPNGDDREIGLLDEMASLVNKTFGEKDGEHTPTGSLHWSIAQYVTPDKPSSAGANSKEDYREAAYRLYMQQEGNKAKGRHKRPSSPAGSSSLNEASTCSPTGGLPKLRSDENVYQAASGEPANSRSIAHTGRSLSNEKFPRSGSWNSHMRITSPVLPSKYVAPEKTEKISEDKAQSRRKSIPSGNESPTMSTGSNSTLESHPRSASSSAETTPTRQRSSPVLSSTPIIPKGSSNSTTSSNSSSSSSSKSSDAKSSKSSKRRPPPLDGTSRSHNGEARGCDSDREGSLTPTNESPPALDVADEPTTPKDNETFSKKLEGALMDGVPPTKSVSFSSSVENASSSSPQSGQRKNKPAPPPTPPKSGKRLSALMMDDMEIQDLETSPTTTRRLPSVSSPEHEPEENDASTDNLSNSPKDGAWPRLASPRRRAEKDVFKFLKESDPNYTIRRQQMQMNLLLEKNQHVKQTVENLVGVQLSDDLGEWISDGVVLCRVVNKLHPGTITTIHSPQSGQSLSRIKRTINISAFIDACKTLKVPEEELCSAGDIIELKDPVRVVACLQRVLESKPGNLI